MAEDKETNSVIESFSVRSNRRLKKIQEYINEISEWNSFPNTYTCDRSEYEKYSCQMLSEACSKCISEIELFALDTRDTIVVQDFFGKGKEEIVASAIVNSYRCRIGYTPKNWFIFELPMLLPKRKDRQETPFLKGIITASLDEYFKSHEEKKRIYNYVFCVVSTYKTDLKKSFQRDNDNLLVSAVINSFSRVVSGDDNPSEMDLFVTSDIGEENITTFYLIPRADFPEWINLKNNGKLKTLSFE